MQRVKLGLVCWLCFCLAVGPVGLQGQQVNDPAGVAVLQDISGSATFNGTYFNIRTMTGDGVGYRNGYTQIGATLPIWLNEDLFIAPTARLLVTDTSKVGASGGVQMRGYLEDWDRILGTYVMFDYDESTSGYNYRQLGFGFETLGEFWDARSNIYLPTSAGNNFVRPLGLLDTLFFGSNYLYFTGVGEFEEALQGADVEFGVPLLPSTPWLRGYAGMYYYDGVSEDPVGFRGRVEAWVSDDLQVAVNVTEDRKFGTNVNAVVDFRFSGFKPTRYFPQWETRERMLMPIQRNWRIATGFYADIVPVPAVNCATGVPYFVSWIDNSNPNPGDGSYENPYNYLPTQLPGTDLILVRRGNTTLATPLVGSIALFDNQYLLGEGAEHFIQMCATFGAFHLEGRYALPGFENTGNYPVLSSNANIITLANGNTVGGFNLVDATGMAIANNPGVGSFGFELYSMNISGNGGGIFLGNVGGNGVIRDVNVTDNFAGGIYLDTGSNPLHLSLTDVHANGTSPGLQGVGIALHADEGDLLASLQNVSATGNGTGFLLSATNGATLQFTPVANVTANGNYGTGIQAFGSTLGRLNLNLSGVQANNNDGHGVSVVADNTFLTLIADGFNANDNMLDNMILTLSFATMQVDLSNSSLDGSLTGSGLVVTNSGGGGSMTLQNISASNNAQYGLLAGATNAALVDITVDNSLFDLNGIDGVHLFGNSGGVINFSDPDVLMTYNGRDGFHFDFRGGSILFADLVGTSLYNNDRHAVFGFLDDATALVSMQDVSGYNSGSDGMRLELRNNGVLLLDATNGSFAESGQSSDPAAAVRVIADNNATALMTLTGVSMNNSLPGGTQDDGLAVLARNNSLVNIDVTGGTLIYNNSNAMEVIADTASDVAIQLDQTPASDSGEDGWLVQALNGSTVQLLATQSTLERSGNNGINAYLDNAANVVINLLDTPVSFSGDNGLLVWANNNSQFTGVFNNSTFANSGRNFNGLGFQDAHRLIGHNSSSISITAANSFTNNSALPASQQHGLWALMTNGSTLNYLDWDGNKNNNLINAINVTLLSGSYGGLNLANTSASGSGQDGFLFVVDNSVLDAQISLGTFNNSGSGGVTGSAINGTLTNTALARLTVFDTPARFALDHGLIINASGNSVFQGQFSNSPFDFAGVPGGIPTTNGNAVYLISNSSTIDLQLINGTTGNNTGGNGLVIDAANSSLVTVDVQDGSFANTGQNSNLGRGVSIIDDNSTVIVNLTNTPLQNTASNTTQAWGIMFDVFNGGQLSLTSTDGSIFRNRIDGINGNVDGPGSSAQLTLINTPVTQNGFNGAIFNITNGGQLVFAIPSGGSISNNGNFGVFVNVENPGSYAEFNFTNVTIDQNGLFFGGDGFGASVTDGAELVANFSGGSINENANQGIELYLDSSQATLALNNVAVNLNNEEGLLFEMVGSNPVLQLTAIGSSFSDNGQAGVAPFGYDNVHGIMHAGMADLLFSAVTADRSTRDGLRFDVDDVDGASVFTAQLNNGTSASQNPTGGVRVTATGVGTQANLLMTGANSFNNNGALATADGSGVFFEANNVEQAVLRFAGSASNNGNPAALLGDHDGVTFVVNGAQFVAVEAMGPGSVNANVQEGIDVRLAGVNNVQSRTVLTQSGPITVRPLAMENLGVQSNGSDGVSVFITGPTVVTGEMLFNALTMTDNQGDGLVLGLNNVAGTPDLRISNNQSSRNTGHGLNLLLTNAPLNQVNIVNNGAGAALPAGTLSFNFTNLIWTTFMDNNSSPGFDIANVTLNIAPAGQVWRPDLNPFSPGRFQPQGATDVTVGLYAVNGNLITPGTDPLQDNFGNPLPGGGVTPGTSVISLDFNDFNPGEQLHYELAHSLLGSDTMETGATLTGSVGVVTLADGRSASGVFTSSGLTINQFFPAQLPGISSNGLDGIHFELTNSNINQMTIDGNAITDNGDDGIDFAVVANSNLVAPGEVLYITNNAITGNGTTTGPAGHGIVLVNPQTVDTNLNLVLEGNDISTNSGRGVDLQLGLPLNTLDLAVRSNTINNNGSQGINLNANDGLDVTLAVIDNGGINGNVAEGLNITLTAGSNLNIPQFYGNTIGTTGNGNGNHGVRLTVPDAAMFSWNLGDINQGSNVIAGNSGAGVSIDMTGSSAGALTVLNTTITNTSSAGPADPGDGLRVTMTDNATLPVLIIGDPVSNNTSFSNNARHGIYLELNGFASVINPLVQRTVASNNGLDGLNVLRLGNAILDNFLIDNSQFNGNEDDGVDVSARNSPTVDEYTILNSVFSDNGDTGLSLDAQADAQIDAILMNNQFVNNGADGVRITTVTVSPGDAALVFSSSPWTQNTFSNNGLVVGAAGAGLEISGIHNLQIGTLANGNIFSNNRGDGIEVNASGILTVTNAQITNNNLSGTADGLAGIDINTSGFNIVTVTDSLIRGNLGDGVEIDNTSLASSAYTFNNNTIDFNGRDGVEYRNSGVSSLSINASSITDNGTAGVGGRGVDVIVAGGSAVDATVSISNSTVQRNRQEGVYVILSTDAGARVAGRDALAGAALTDAGAVTNTPFLNFSLTNSIVADNGQAVGNIGGAGLVMRVGTTGGGYGFTNPGGFANAANGGIIATVNNNSFFGNFGADALFESFVSTAVPGATAGQWTDQNENPRNFANDVFTVTSYVGDPLARLDLTFQNNVLQEVDATRPGAFYNNNEPEFKSRGVTGVSSDTAADGGFDDNGPFQSGTRQRNAQRQGARNVGLGGTQLPPLLTIGGSDNFLFPGLGPSTFRANTAGSVWGAGSGFTFDNAPYVSIFDANGVLTGAPLLEFMPYGWGQLP